MTLTAITEAIYTAIKTNVTALNNRVFPLVATEGTNLPFAVFERTGYNRNTKDGGILEVTFEVRIVSNTYFEGLQIADTVIDTLERTPYKATLTGSSEEYTNDGYLQTLTFLI